jgi:hypothetical protein
MASSLASGMLGRAWLERGEPATAIPLLEDAVERLNSIPVTSAVSRNMAFLGEAYLMVGDVGRARAMVADALALSREAASTFNVAVAERALGRIALATGDPAAVDYLRSSLQAFTACEAAIDVAVTHVWLAEAQAAAGDPAAARAHLDLACEAFTTANTPRRLEAARALAVRLGLAPAIS